MRKRFAVAASLVATAALTLGVLAFAAQAAPPERNEATVISHVTIDKNDPSIAYVKARYTCQPEIDHLWVSVKQAADGSADPALLQDGSGFGHVAAAWLQAHPTNFTCDGKNHVQTFQVDTTEQGYGSLIRGQAYVQFCLTTEADSDLLVADMNFQSVK
jgi:hypothetical protein